MGVGSKQPTRGKHDLFHTCEIEEANSSTSSWFTQVYFSFLYDWPCHS